MFTRAGATLGRVAATRAAAQTSVVARRAAVPVTRRAALSTEAAAADAGAASKGSIWDKLPRDPNYEGFMGVAKYYFPTNDKVRAVVECPACVCIPSSLLSHQPRCSTLVPARTCFRVSLPFAVELFFLGHCVVPHPDL